MQSSAAVTAAILYAEINVLSFVVMIVIATNAIKVRGAVTYRTLLFTSSVLAMASANFFDFLWNVGITEYWILPADMRKTINFFYFVSLALSGYCWLLYTEAAYFGKMPTKKNCLSAAPPLLLLIGMLLISHFTGCVFSIDAAGVYSRGPLYYCQHLFSYCYIGIASALCYYRALQPKNISCRRELLGLGQFVLPLIPCTLLQIAVQNVPILSTGMVISFLLVFVSILKNMISEDELTEIPGRRELIRYLPAELKSLKPGEPLYFLFMDIDRFKQINDEFGHSEGDRALRALASVLKQVSDETDSFCARYGGDEFVFVTRGREEEAVQEIEHRIHKLVEKKNREISLKRALTLSIGRTRYREEMNGMAQLISTADADMYEKKAQKKRAELAAALPHDAPDEEK